MERVLGIGGHFMRAADPAALSAWYRDCLGLDTDEHGLTLRAGSKRNQHIVAFDKNDADSAGGPTKFTLIALDLPAETWKKGRETD